MDLLLVLAFMFFAGLLFGLAVSKILQDSGRRRFWIHRQHRYPMAQIYVRTSKPDKDPTEWIEVIEK